MDGRQRCECEGTLSCLAGWVFRGELLWLVKLRCFEGGEIDEVGSLDVSTFWRAGHRNEKQPH
jgi:hypothetical protein